MLGRGGLREEYGGAIRDERCLLKEAWWRHKTMLEENIEREEKLRLRNKDGERKEERKVESRFEEKSRRESIAQVAIDYFENMYKTASPTLMHEITAAIPTKVTEEMNESLNKNFTRDKVTIALK